MLMDWDLAIERNSEALKRILASLFAMAGLGGASTSPLWGGRPSPDGRVGVVIGGTKPPPHASRRPPHKGEVERPTLPRYLHTAVLRILRPAESAMRRLIVVASRGIVITLPPPRPPKAPKAVPVETILRGLGIAVTLSPADLAAAAAAAKRAAEARAARAARPQSVSLPLLDPLKNHFGPRRKFVPPHLGPRVSSLGGGERRALPPPPSRDDPVDATRIGQRIAALAAALDDLPGQAKRFARWTARVATGHSRRKETVQQARRLDSRCLIAAAGRFESGRCARAGRPASTQETAGKAPGTRCMTS